MQELMSSSSYESYIFELSVEQLASDNGLEEEDVGRHLSRLIKNELKYRLDKDDREGVKSVLEVLRKKDCRELSRIFDITETKAMHLRNSIIYDRFFSLINPDLTIYEKMGETGLSKNTVFGYITALKTILPYSEFYKRGMRRRSIGRPDRFDGLSEHIRSFVKKKGGVTNAELVDSCIERFGGKRGEPKRQTLKEVYSMKDKLEKNGDIIFFKGRYELGETV